MQHDHASPERPPSPIAGWVLALLVAGAVAVYLVLNWSTVAVPLGQVARALAS